MIPLPLPPYLRVEKCSLHDRCAALRAGHPGEPIYVELHLPPDVSRAVFDHMEMVLRWWPRYRPPNPKAKPKPKRGVVVRLAPERGP